MQKFYEYRSIWPSYVLQYIHFACFWPKIYSKTRGSNAPPCSPSAPPQQNQGVHCSPLLPSTGVPDFSGHLHISQKRGLIWTVLIMWMHFSKQSGHTEFVMAVGNLLDFAFQQLIITLLLELHLQLGNGFGSILRFSFESLDLILGLFSQSC